MAQTGEIYRDASRRWRDCDTNQFVSPPDEIAEGTDSPGVADTGLRNRTELREAAMDLSRKLRRTIQPRRKKPKTPDHKTDHASQDRASQDRAAQHGAAQDAQPDEKPKAAEAAPEIARLLGRNDGVIDGFAALAQLVIRLFDKEKEAREQAKSALPGDEFDEEELDRRIAEELDRIAERRRAADGIESAERQDGEAGLSV